MNGMFYGGSRLISEVSTPMMVMTKSGRLIA